MSDAPKTPEPKKRTFNRQMIVEFVDLMMLGDQIVAEYRRRKDDGGESNDFVELDFNDRLHLASTLMGLQMRDSMMGDAETRKAAFERMKELERLALEEAGAAPPDASPPPPQVVRLDPALVEKSFAALAEQNGVPNARARQFVKLLMETPEGNQMLQLMLHDVVHHRRGT